MLSDILPRHFFFSSIQYIVLPTCPYKGKLDVPDLFPACTGPEPGKHPELEKSPSQRIRFYCASCNLRWDPVPQQSHVLESACCLFFSPCEDEMVQTADASPRTLPRCVAQCCPSCSVARPAALSRHQLASLKWQRVLCQLCVSGANLRLPK